MKNILVLTAFFLNLVALSISFGWMYFDWGFDSVITSIGLASSLAVVSLEVIKKYSILLKGKDIVISMLGTHNAGKTVYATVLFDEMQKFQDNLFQFMPLEIETIEFMAYSVKNLYSGIATPPTPPGYLSRYSGIVTYNSKPIKKQFSLTVGDWSGEDYHYVANAAQKNEMEWLHKSDYFNYVIHSDIIFLMLDVTELTDKERREILVSEMLAAILVYYQKKSPKPNHKIETPVCLLFMKSDTLNISKGEILEITDRLIKVCQLRVENFSHYFVSSIGTGNKFGKPMQLKPENVIEPLLWAIRKL